MGSTSNNCKEEKAGRSLVDPGAAEVTMGIASILFQALFLLEWGVWEHQPVTCCLSGACSMIVHDEVEVGPRGWQQAQSPRCRDPAFT